MRDVIVSEPGIWLQPGESHQVGFEIVHAEPGEPGHWGIDSSYRAILDLRGARALYRTFKPVARVFAQLDWGAILAWLVLPAACWALLFFWIGWTVHHA